MHGSPAWTRRTGGFDRTGGADPWIGAILYHRGWLLEVVRAQHLSLGTDIDIARAVVDKVARSIIAALVFPIRQRHVRPNAYVLECLNVFHGPIGGIAGHLFGMELPAEMGVPG